MRDQTSDGLYSANRPIGSAHNFAVKMERENEKDRENRERENEKDRENRERENEKEKMRKTERTEKEKMRKTET